MLTPKADAIIEQREFLFKYGFLHVKNLLSKEILLDINSSIDWALFNPSPFKIHKKNEGSEFFMDFGNWRRSEIIKKVCFNIPLASFVSEIIQSKQIRLMHEDIIVKEGSFDNATPPHHDRPYFVFAGDRNISAWIATDDVSSDSSLICYKGSHLTSNVYRPKRFDNADDIFLDKSNQNILKLTDLDEQQLRSYEEVVFDFRKGDAILFFNTTLHASKNNASGKSRRTFIIRYLSDDAYLTDNPYAVVPPYSRMGVDFSDPQNISDKLFPNIL